MFQIQHRRRDPSKTIHHALDHPNIQSRQFVRHAIVLCIDMVAVLDAVNIIILS
jgi:hypothetical protein